LEIALTYHQREELPCSGGGFYMDVIELSIVGDKRIDLSEMIPVMIKPLGAHFRPV
jgi:hypothetical protein